MADIKLDSFKSQLKDVARSSRFFVTITGNQAGASWQETPMAFMVKSFVLPDRVIGEIELKWQGMTSKISGDPTFGDCSMVLWNDYDFTVKSYFEQWMEGFVTIGQDGTNTRLAPEDYKAQIKVEQLGRNGETIASYILVGCIPKNMSTVELNQDSTDQGEEITIDFSIDMWYRE